MEQVKPSAASAARPRSRCRQRAGPRRLGRAQELLRRFGRLSPNLLHPRRRCPPHAAARGLRRSGNRRGHGFRIANVSTRARQPHPTVLFDELKRGDGRACWRSGGDHAPLRGCGWHVTGEHGVYREAILPAWIFSETTRRSCEGSSVPSGPTSCSIRARSSHHTLRRRGPQPDPQRVPGRHLVHLRLDPPITLERRAMAQVRRSAELHGGWHRGPTSSCRNPSRALRARRDADESVVPWGGVPRSAGNMPRQVHTSST